MLHQLELVPLAHLLYRFVHKLDTVHFYWRCAWIWILAATNVKICTVSDQHQTRDTVYRETKRVVVSARSRRERFSLKKSKNSTGLANTMHLHCEITKSHNAYNSVHIFVERSHLGFCISLRKAFQRLDNLLAVILLQIRQSYRDELSATSGCLHSRPIDHNRHREYTFRLSC